MTTPLTRRPYTRTALTNRVPVVGDRFTVYSRTRFGGHQISAYQACKKGKIRETKTTLARPVVDAAESWGLLGRPYEQVEYLAPKTLVKIDHVYKTVVEFEQVTSKMYKVYLQ